MEQECDEFDRLFGIFKEMNPSAADEWMKHVEQFGILSEVCYLANAYKKQNLEIHDFCLHCNPVVDCSLEQREEDWLKSGRLETFPFESGKVSEVGWGAFSFLLTASVHANELAKKLGRNPKTDELCNDDCRKWYERLAARFLPVRRYLAT